MSNHIIIMGRLGNNPEIRHTPSGQKVTSFRLASNLRRGDKEKTIWWKVIIFGDNLSKILVHLKKGSAVIVMGELQMPQTYRGKDGANKADLTVIAVDISFSPFGSQKSDSKENVNKPSSEPGVPMDPQIDMREMLEEEIPF